MNIVPSTAQADFFATPSNLSQKSTGEKILNDFSQEWLTTLEREDKKKSCNVFVQNLHRCIGKS